MINLPDDFTKRYLSMYGNSAKAWLEDLPELRDRLYKRWSLIKTGSFIELSFNYLEYVKNTQGKDAVLKIGFPNPELSTEIHALEIYNGEGVVRLIDSDSQSGALLLERIIPGDNLLSIADDNQRTQISAQVMKRIWHPAPEGHNFPSMKKWCQAFNRYNQAYPDADGPLDKNLIQKAERLAIELLQDKQKHFLLHGDLHHMNILRHGSSRWVAIDPKGVTGEIAFEAGPFLYNPIPELMNYRDLESTVKNRIDTLEAVAGIDMHRMIAWSAVRAVLSSIWSIEDRTENPKYGIQFAKLFFKMIK